MFLQGVEGIFLFLCKKIAIRLHFLKSYSFAINDIKLLFNICISRLLLNFLHLSTINREISTVTIALNFLKIL